MARKPTHVVSHPSVYLAVGGKLQEMPKGAEIALEPGEETDRMEKRGFVVALGKAKQVELDAGKAAADKAAADKAAGAPPPPPAGK